MSKMLKSALWYAQMRGWAVIPLHWVENGQCSCSKGADCSSPAKHPIISNGVKGASRDSDQVTQWWTQYPRANIAVVTGFENSIFVLDVDPRNEGHISLDELTDGYGELPDTVESHTARGGQHYFYLFEDGIKNRNEFVAGLDVKSTNGYIVAPPSETPDGSYEWELSSTPDNTIEKSPQWLTQLILKDDKVQASNGLKKQPKSHWDSIIKGVDEGSRNESATSLSGLLINRFFDNLEIAWWLLVAWNNQNAKPLNEDELMTTFRSVLNREIQRRKGA